jgi:hypothetical protein
MGACAGVVVSERRMGDPRCKDCSADHEPGKSRCAACADRHRQESSALAKKRRAAGLCVTCGGKVAKRKRDKEPGKYCKAHAEYYLARSAKV